MSTAELMSWLQQPDPRTFPYAAVVREYHRVGKHFVATELLDLLALVRTALPTVRGPWSQVRLLANFLNTALDKPDKRYDYSTYLALSLLDLPDIDDPIEQAPFARSRCDRLTVQLVSDALAFETSVLAGDTALLPDLRPTEDLIGKRCRHGLRVVRPALARLSLEHGLTATEPVDLSREVYAAVLADMSVVERRALGLSVLPVHTAHDEYLFLRVLQAFETTFALIVTQLRGLLAALAEHVVDRALHFLAAATAALRESAPLFSMLATMQVESFRHFRQFTDGASAIQSRNYKLMEALCREPDRDRLDSAAFHSVPDVRDRVVDGQLTTVDAGYQQACRSGLLTEADRHRLGEAMLSFADALSRWRQTHYRLAMRMLGDAPGTGYTKGTPYLDAVRAVPVFLGVAATDDQPASTR